MNEELIERLYGAGHNDIMAEAAERIAELEAELSEQARLLGMGGEREAALLGRLERSERKLAIAREALHFAVTMPRSFEANRRAAQALEQIS